MEPAAWVLLWLLGQAAWVAGVGQLGSDPWFCMKITVPRDNGSRQQCVVFLNVDVIYYRLTRVKGRCSLEAVQEILATRGKAAEKHRRCCLQAFSY